LSRSGSSRGSSSLLRSSLKNAPEMRFDPALPRWRRYGSRTVFADHGGADRSSGVLLGRNCTETVRGGRTSCPPAAIVASRRVAYGPMRSSPPALSTTTYQCLHMVPLDPGSIGPWHPVYIHCLASSGSAPGHGGMVGPKGRRRQRVSPTPQRSCQFAWCRAGLSRSGRPSRGGAVWRDVVVWTRRSGLGGPWPARRGYGRVGGGGLLRSGLSAVRYPKTYRAMDVAMP
jgi:hypothetical protein